MLFNRFREYLDKQFKSVPDSKEANDFREELLSNLMSRAMELKEDKSLTEDQIYQKCIDSLGDYSEALRKLSGNPIDTLRDKRLWRDVMFALTFALISVIVYIAVSFVTKKWGLTAIIVFPSMAGIMYIFFTAKILASSTALKRHALTGLILSSYAVLITLAAFFVLAFAGSVKIGPRKAWVVFTYIPFWVSAASAITFAVFRKKKVPLIIIVLGACSFFVAAFLTASVAIGRWHPTWLIVLGAPISALIAGIFAVNKRMKASGK